MKVEVIKLDQKMSQFGLDRKSREENIMKHGSILVLFVVLTLIVIVNNSAQTPPQPTGNAGSDLGGSYPNPTVQNLNGRPLSNAAPAVGDTLRWNGTAWEPAKNLSNSGPKLNAESGLSLDGLTLGAQNTKAIWNANQIAGRNLAPTTPTKGQVLKWNGTAWVPSPIAAPVRLQTYFKNGISQRSGEINRLPAFAEGFVVTEISHEIVLAKKSRLIISGMINTYGPNCALCKSSRGQFVINITDLLVDPNDFYGKQRGGAGVVFDVSMHSMGAATISNYMVDLNKGTYSLKFRVYAHSDSPVVIEAKQSSIIVIPLE